jgi:hypothetical protein
MSKQLKMNDKKLLCKPSTETVEKWSDGAAEKAELRHTGLKTEQTNE